MPVLRTAQTSEQSKVSSIAESSLRSGWRLTLPFAPRTCAIDPNSVTGVIHPEAARLVVTAPSNEWQFHPRSFGVNLKIAKPQARDHISAPFYSLRRRGFRVIATYAPK